MSAAKPAKSFCSKRFYGRSEDCLRGNIKSVGFLLNRYYAAAANDTAQADLGEDDKAVLEAYLREFKKSEDEGGDS